MKKILDAAEYGIRTNHEIMENGERRFRLLAPDGTSYIRNEKEGEPVWENAHYHKTIQELILVQKGSMIYVEQRENGLEYQELGPGEMVCTTPGIPHNICVGENSVTHTIKYGDCSCQDWIFCRELDEEVKKLSYEQAAKKCNK